MGYKMNTGISWSTLELTGLLEDEDSRVFFERSRRHLGLHPFHLNDLSAALREILNNSLNTYDAALKGIILSHKNPKLLTALGDVLYDSCYIHIDIEADFYIFRPEVGCSLKGIVNKKSEDHVGILVHKAFNVSIPKPEDDEDWPGYQVSVGQEVRFTITHIDFKGRLPYIRGVLKAKEYFKGCKLFSAETTDVHNTETKRKKNKSCKEKERTIVDSPKSTKRKNKHITFDSDTEENESERKVSPEKDLEKCRISNVEIYQAGSTKIKTEKTKSSASEKETIKRKSKHTIINNHDDDEDGKDKLLSKEYPIKLEVDPLVNVDVKPKIKKKRKHTIINSHSENEEESNSQKHLKRVKSIKLEK